jgi:preprotein translocase subunit SecB
MAQSPLIIEGYNLSQLEWFETADIVLEEDSINHEFDVATTIENHPEDKAAWRVKLQVSSKKTDTVNPVSFNISYTGYFRVLDGYPEEMREKLVAVNGSSILYAAAREMLMQLSGRSIHGTFILPSISFVDVPTGNQRSEGTPKPKTKVRKKR